jgi:hypothetical protein
VRLESLILSKGILRHRLLDLVVGNHSLLLHDILSTKEVVGSRLYRIAVAHGLSNKAAIDLRLEICRLVAERSCSLNHPCRFLAEKACLTLSAVDCCLIHVLSDRSIAVLSRRDLIGKTGC